MYRNCLIALLLATPLAVHADPLSQADREALIEKLDTLRDSAKEKAVGRMESASTAFRTAMASDDAAVELYLKCVEKVEFSDQKKTSQDFREWKRRQGEKLEGEGLKRCLRHQLRWLVLTMEAAESNGKTTALAIKASEALESIYGTPQQFDGNVQPLREPVTNSIFAKAYNLSGIKVDKWPLSPLELNQVFGQVIFPPLREKGNIEALRTQWQRRILYEGVDKQYWGGGGGGGREGGREGGKEHEKGGKREESSAEYEKFVNETQPDLIWQMEEDLYRSGDQKGAAVRMLEHIEKHLAHPKAREWAERFKALIDPGKEAGAATVDKAAP